MKIALTIFLLYTIVPGARAQDTAFLQKKPHKFLRAMIAPTLLVVGGLSAIDADHDDDFFINRYTVARERNKEFAHFHTTADNILQFVPAVGVYALDLGRVRGQHNLANQTALLIKSELLMTAIVFPLKNITHVLRPDRSNYHSFPSGHTAQAFAAATFLQKEYGSISVWYTISGYSVATLVGVCRILNNKHWLSDVLVGAGIGIFSTNLVYLTHQNKWGKKGNKLTLLPTYNKGAGLYLSYVFR